MKAHDIPVAIIAHGSVRARTSTQLTAQVSGQIIAVNPEFQDGGFFREGDVLVTIDPVQYRTQVASAKAQVATAQLALEREEALAKRNRRDWKRLDQGEATGLAANVPQLAKARADVLAADAALRSAEHDLANTRIRAPYTGRVRSKMADVGQSVSALGAVLADIYAIDYAEIVLPLPSEDVWFLDLPELGKATPPTDRIPVTLKGDVGGGNEASWQGRIDRSTGLVDPQSRFVSVIVRVEDPHGLDSNTADKPILQIGQFVRAEIRGRILKSAFVVPREAILPGDRVLIVKEVKQVRSRNSDDTMGDDEPKGTLEARPVTIVRKESERVLVTDGLQNGNIVSVTRLPFYAEGMLVRPVPTTAEEPVGELLQQVQP